MEDYPAKATGVYITCHQAELARSMHAATPAGAEDDSGNVGWAKRPGVESLLFGRRRLLWLNWVQRRADEMIITKASFMGVGPWARVAYPFSLRLAGAWNGLRCLARQQP